MLEKIVRFFFNFSSFLAEDKDTRKKLLIFSLVSLSSTLLLAFLIYKEVITWQVYGPEHKKDLVQTFLVLSLLPIAILFVIGNSYLVKYRTNSEFDEEIEELKVERKEIKKRILDQDDNDNNVFDTIQLGLNQLTEYYTINKQQAKKSYSLSLFAIIIGFVTIIGGVWMFYFKANPNIKLTSITAVSGTIIEFIGACYFYMYRKSLEQLNFFYTKLIVSQDTMLAIKLVEDIDQRFNEKQVELKEKIVVSLLNRNDHN